MHVSEEILNKYTTLFVTRTWKEIFFDFDNSSRHECVIAKEVTDGSIPNNYLKIRKQWFFYKETKIYEISSPLTFNRDFSFIRTWKFQRFIYEDSQGTPLIKVVPKSQIHQYRSAEVCNYMDFQSSYAVSHFVARGDEVVGVVYLPSEYNSGKRYPFAKVRSDLESQQILPVIIAFCLGEDYGVERNYSDLA